MRLVDADKLIDNLEWLNEADYILFDEVKETVKNTTTVKAIPIEWIEKWGWKNGMSESMSLRVMIEDWEKENEKLV